MDVSEDESNYSGISNEDVEFEGVNDELSASDDENSVLLANEDYTNDVSDVDVNEELDSTDGESPAGVQFDEDFENCECSLSSIKEEPLSESEAGPSSNALLGGDSEHALSPLSIKEEPNSESEAADVRERIRQPSPIGDNGKLDPSGSQNCVSREEIKRARKKEKITLPVPYTAPRLTDGRLLHCYYCEYSCQYKSRLIEHMTKHFPGKHVCDECGKTFGLRRILRQHLRYHSSKLNCPSCDFTTKYPNNLKNHVKRFHGTTLVPKQTPTILGNKQFQGITNTEMSSTAKTRMKKKLKEKRKFPPEYTGPRDIRKGYFYCYYCPKGFQNKISIKGHIPSHLPLEFFCKVCGFGFSTIHGLRTHYKRHLSVNTFQCRICPFTTKYETRLPEHVSKVHGKKVKTVSKISCFYCGWSTKFKSRLIDHIKLHRASLQCDTCEYRAYSKTNLLRHKSDAHPDVLLKCDFCDFETTLECDLKKHSFKHSQCVVCKFRVKDPTDLKSHKCSIDNASVTLNSDGVYWYICNSCSFKSTSLRGLKFHMRNHLSLMYRCPHCPFTVKSSSSFAEHFTTEHSNLDESSDQYPCQICGSEFDTRGQLLTHVKTHVRERKYKCPYCDYVSFTSNYELGDHVRTKHGNVWLECNFCDFKTQNRVVLRRHVKNKHEPRLYPSEIKCKFCDYTSASSSRMAAHELTHTDDKPYPCDACDYRTRYKTSLRKHKLLHEGGVPRPFKCEFCEFVGTAASFKRHLFVHSTDRPYKCNFCGKAFKTEQTAKIHESIHVGRKEYQCPKCAFKSVVSAYVQRHLEKMHPVCQKVEKLPETYPSGRKKNWFHCKKCAYFTCDKLSFTNHTRKYHPQEN